MQGSRRHAEGNGDTRRRESGIEGYQYSSTGVALKNVIINGKSELISDFASIENQTTRAMNDALKFKKSVVDQFIYLKEAEIKNLTSSQRDQLGDTATEDIDLSDPFESTRSQSQDEVGQQSEPIDFLIHELELLKTIRTDEVHTAVTFGSLVESNTGYFLIGASQKQFEFEGKKMTGISVESPLFKKMENMKATAEFHLGNTEYIIRSVS